MCVRSQVESASFLFIDIDYTVLSKSISTESGPGSSILIPSANSNTQPHPVWLNHAMAKQLAMLSTFVSVEV